jgi:ABC-type transport system involved in multi-copper enzyme maturation permease subunit
MNNPIITRECVGQLRKPAALWMQLIWMLALAGMVVLRWPSSGRVDLSGDQAREVLAIFAWTLLAGFMVIVPAFPAASIVAEKRSGTLALLMNSPLSPWQIFMGKFIGSIGFPLLLLAISLPEAVACYVMGGVSIGAQIIPVYLLLLIVAIEATAIGLYVSTRCQSVDAALRLTYAVIFGLFVVTLIPAKFAPRSAPPVVGHYLRMVADISPIPVLQGLISTGGISGKSADIHYYLVAAALVILICGGLTVRRLGQRMFDRPRDSGKITDERSTQVRAYRRFMYLWFFDPQRREKLTGPFSNPVMVKEFRASRFGRSSWMARLVGICLVLSMGLMLATAYGSMQSSGNLMGGLLVVLQIAIIVLITPSLAAGLISSEIQNGSWRLLQMTPLSATSIVIGKLLSVFRTLLLLLLATMPGYLVQLLIAPRETHRILEVVVSLLLTSLLCVIGTTAISSLCRKTASATAIAYAIILALFGGTLLVWLGRQSLFSPGAVSLALRLNPLAAALGAMRMPGFSHLNVIEWNWGFMAVLIILSLVILTARTSQLTKAR